MAGVEELAMGSDNAGQSPEEDLRWQRNNQAALSAMLPSNTAKQNVNRWRSITLKLIHAEQIPEEDLRWRRNSQAALRAMLPSNTAKRVINRWRSITSQLLRAHRDSIQAKTSVIKTTQICSHDEDAVIEDYIQTKENIKSLTATLAVKRKYRDQLVREKSYEFQALVQLGYKRAKAWHNFRSHVRSLVYQLELWAGSFKIIEGHFGSSTVSYFRFLRFLMFLNLYLTLIIFGVIVIPYFILPDASIDKTQYSETYNCSASYRQHTEELKRNSSSAGNIALSILQGTGLLENTVLFYGNYYNMSMSVPVGGVQTYNMSLSYLMATGATFILSFLLLVKNSAKGVKQGILETSGGSLTHQFCNKVFGGWDFCVSSESTASIKHKSLKLELETDLEYQRLYWRKQNRTAKEKLKLVFIRLLINLLCFGILGASLYLIFYVNEKLIALQNEAKKVTEILELLVQYLPSVTITLLSTIVPIIFTKLILAEEYTPLFQIRLTLFRIVLLRLSSLGVLMLSLFTTIKNNEGYQCGNQNSTNDNSNFSTCENCTENDINFTTVDFIGFNETDQLQCWETYLGQQIYKLVIMNFIVVIAVTFLWEFPRKLIYMKFNHLKFVQLLGQQEFDLAKNVLDLVYLQTLSWLGLFFSPLIPAMCCLTYFIFFYVKKLSLLKNCVPHQHYRTSRSSSLFMMVLLLSFALSSIPLIYMIGSIHPSRTCGPFRNYRDEEYFIFTVITYTISNWPDEARLVFTYIGKGPVMAAFAFFICLIMYYFWMVSQGYIKQEQLLREQLKLEGQDKQFLLARMNEFIGTGDKRTTTISTLSG